MIGPLNSLQNYNTDNFNHMLELVDSAKLSMTQSLKEFDSNLEIIKGVVKTVEDMTAQTDSKVDSLTDEQLSGIVKTMLDTLHDKALLEFHNSFESNNLHTLARVESNLKQVSELLKDFDTQVSADKQVDSEFVTEKVEKVFLSKMSECFTDCPTGYNPKDSCCDQCVHAEYEKEWKDTVLAAFSEIDVILGPIKQFQP